MQSEGRLAGGGGSQAFRQWKSARDWGQNFNQGGAFTGHPAKDPDIQKRGSEMNDGIAMADSDIKRQGSGPPI
jgi:hypothetical protein